MVDTRPLIPVNPCLLSKKKKTGRKPIVHSFRSCTKDCRDIWVEMEQGFGRSVGNKVRVPRSRSLMSSLSLPPKKNQIKSNRLLITVTVIGSAGPLRFLVNADESVMSVIEQALKNYAHEGRLPHLGSEFNNFFLYSAHSGTDALSPKESIGSYGGRNFILCKKQRSDVPGVEIVAAKVTPGWKAWLNKSLLVKISSS